MHATNITHLECLVDIHKQLMYGHTALLDLVVPRGDPRLHVLLVNFNGHRLVLAGEQGLSAPVLQEFADLAHVVLHLVQGVGTFFDLGAEM